MKALQTTVVIGGGIVGASVAFHLARRGVQVTVIEADEPGHGASRVSYAWINGRDKSPYHYHELNRRSQDMWRRFVDELRADVGLVWGGEMRWTVTAEGAAELFDVRFRVAQHGQPVGRERVLDEGAVHHSFTHRRDAARGNRACPP